ncbi:MAG TPA: hypothetical protein VM434_04560 [Beijerinckiaceae bacterium]|nr:hypothetical protein [Beijerinckiaceae bacterium]
MITDEQRVTAVIGDFKMGTALRSDLMALIRDVRAEAIRQAAADVLEPNPDMPSTLTSRKAAAERILKRLPLAEVTP